MVLDIASNFVLFNLRTDGGDMSDRKWNIMGMNGTEKVGFAILLLGVIVIMTS